MPEVSIITPAYIDSGEKLEWLAECLASVLAQPFADWEQVIVDDGSPLLLGRVRESFPDPRFRWYKGAGRQGPALCRNTAVALALSDALLPLDADDRLAPEALPRMLDAWRPDRTRVVYGDLQRIERGADGVYREGRTYGLPDYSFERSLDPSGIMPVTALHSKEAHTAAGGWKAELDAGLEDVEYCIACGERGFCGLHVPVVTLLYRRHDTGRAHLLRSVVRREAEMRNKIRAMHADSYEGRYAMTCCGGGRANTAVTSASAAAAAAPPRATTLDQYPAGEKVWVQYKGKREASFGVSGEYTGITYEVQGTGHKFEVHVSDLPKFRRSGRGSDFAIGVPPPAEAQPAISTPAPAPAPQPAARPAPPQPAPALATLERLDRSAVEAGLTAEVRSDGRDARLLRVMEEMRLGPVGQQMLADGMTLEKLAGSTVSQLTAYKGIGLVRAAQIVERARKELSG